MKRSLKPFTEKNSFTHEPKWFSEIFRYKEFAGSRTEKARGCFGSNKVSKLPTCSAKKQLNICLLQRELSKESVNTFVAYLPPCVGLKRNGSKGLTYESRELNSPRQR